MQASSSHPLGLIAINYDNRKAGKHPSHPSEKLSVSASETAHARLSPELFSEGEMVGTTVCHKPKTGTGSFPSALRGARTVTWSLMSCLAIVTGDIGTNDRHGL